MIYISHRFEEFSASATGSRSFAMGGTSRPVCRGNQYARTHWHDDWSRHQRPLPQEPGPIGQPVLEVSNRRDTGFLGDVSLSVRVANRRPRGTGGRGAYRACSRDFGDLAMDSGTINVDGILRRGILPRGHFAGGPRARRPQGPGASDRPLGPREHLDGDASVLVANKRPSRRSEKRLAEDYVHPLAIKTPSIDQKAST